MKILVVDEWIPLPLHSGKKIRTFNLLKNLAKTNEVILLAPVKNPPDSNHIQQLKEHHIDLIPVPDTRSPRDSLWFKLSVMKNYFFSNVPFSTDYHVYNALNTGLRQAVADNHPDVILIEWTNLAPVLTGLDVNIPVCISAHNIEYEIWERYAENASNIPVKLIAKTQAQRIKTMEKFWYQRVKGCIAVSERDAGIMRDLGADVCVVDNGVDIDYYNQSVEACVGMNGNCISFIASLDTFANQDAFHWFVREVLPILRTERVECRFFAVGKEPPLNIQKFEKIHPDIIVTGEVKDTREYLKGSNIIVVPLRIGGGSRLKILEAMAAGVPVVSTAIGAEGLKIADHEDILIADTAEAFAHSISRLLSDAELRLKLTKKAKKIVSENYDWSKLAEKLNSYLISLKTS